jgi:hypothetical protein
LLNNKFSFIEAGESKLEKFCVVCSMCVIDKETFDNLIIIENLRFANIKKIKKINIDRDSQQAKGIPSYISTPLKISGSEPFVYDSLKEILSNFIKNYREINEQI